MSKQQSKDELMAEFFRMLMADAQQAQNETFAIREVDPVRAPGEYVIANAKTRNEYRVSYYGEGHPLNSCFCMVLS